MVNPTTIGDWISHLEAMEALLQNKEMIAYITNPEKPYAQSSPQVCKMLQGDGPDTLSSFVFDALSGLEDDLEAL